jgi:hypothetical protein
MVPMPRLHRQLAGQLWMVRLIVFREWLSQAKLFLLALNRSPFVIVVAVGLGQAPTKCH